MQTNILWSGIEYHSLENCIIDSTNDAVIINSAILGFYNGTIYRVEYIIRLDRNWQTNFCSVNCRLNNEVSTFEFVHDQNTWTMNGEYRPEFDGCTDVDIPLTPLTNSLPINRLKLKVGEAKEIDVVYIDLLEHRIRHVRQKYRRVSDDVCKYENIPNDFEAEIKTDAAGFVIEYPQLFTRTAKHIH